MVGQQGQTRAVRFGEVHPVQHNVVLDLVPGREIGVLLAALADVERGILPQPRRREGRGKPDIELVAAVVAGAAVPGKDVLLGKGADADVVPPVDTEVEVDLRVAPAQGDRLREGVRGDGAADADALYKVVVAEQDDLGRVLRRGAEASLVVEVAP